MLCTIRFNKYETPGYIIAKRAAASIEMNKYCHVLQNSTNIMASLILQFDRGPEDKQMWHRPTQLTQRGRLLYAVLARKAETRGGLDALILY